jgi:HNH endonuclease
MNKYSKSRNLLRKLNAPHSVQSLFDELCEIDSSFPPELRAKPSELLQDACRRFNYTEPFSSDGRKRHFRSKLLDTDHPDFARDCVPFGDEPHAAALEQSYRRGFVQGFAELRRHVFGKKVPKDISKMETKFQLWRTSSLQIIGSAPGSDESFEFFLDKIPQISPKLRYRIFSRDKFKCQICGLSAKDGTTIEVDHKISIFNGGDNKEENLWTLCFDCNRGKGTSSI